MASKALSGCFALIFFVSLSTLSFGTVVTGGTFGVYPGGIPGFPGGQPGDFYLTAGGFLSWGSVNGGYWPANCFPCAPGTVLNIDGSAAGADFGSGLAYVGNNPPLSVDWGNVDAPLQSLFSFTGPGIWLNRGAGVYTGPFSFTGSLCGFDPASTTCVVDLPNLSGSGVVLAVTEQPENGLLYVDLVTYVFQTPEPGTLVLFGSSVVGLAGLMKRKLKP